MRRAASVLVWGAGLFLLWLLLVGTWQRLELVAGACAALVGAVAAEAVRSQRLLRFRLERRWAVRAWRVPWSIVREFAVVLAAIPARPRGRFRAIPFPAGGDDATGAGRRAFAALAGTLSPNTIVVDVDRDRKQALVHDLVPARASEEVV